MRKFQKFHIGDRIVLDRTRYPKMMEFLDEFGYDSVYSNKYLTLYFPSSYNDFLERVKERMK